MTGNIVRCTFRGENIEAGAFPVVALSLKDYILKHLESTGSITATPTLLDSTNEFAAVIGQLFIGATYDEDHSGD